MAIAAATAIEKNLLSHDTSPSCKNLAVGSGVQPYLLRRPLI
jgi:hypothetical protein